MSSGIYSLLIQRVATYNNTFQWNDQQNTPIDLTGYTLKFVAREVADPLSPQLIQYTSPCFQLSITNPLTGQFQITIPAGDTATYTWTNAVYDLVAISSGGVVTQLLRGSINITDLV
jgi:hypothetical protein